MKKNRHIMAISALTIITAFVLLLVFAKIFILGSFEKLENEQGRSKVEQALSIISNELSSMQSMAFDWADWDDAYQFLADANPVFVQRNLTSNAFQIIKATAMVYVTYDGTVRYGMELDRDGKGLKPVSSSLLERARQLARNPVAGGKSVETNGILMLPEGPYLVAFRSVTDSSGKGTPRGIVLMGRRLDTAEILKISRMVQVTCSMHPISAEFQPILNAFGQLPLGTQPILVRETGKGTAIGYALVKDMDGKPAVIVSLDLPRRIYDTGKEAVYYFLAWIMAIISLVVPGTLLLKQKLSRSRQEREKADMRLAKLNDCFLSFTANPDDNMRRITILCGELMDSACALYNRLDHGMLTTLADWNSPSDYNPVDRPDGHICYDVIKRGAGILFVQDLPSSTYAATDPNVLAYGLKTYIGAPVQCRGTTVGSLCVVYQKDHSPVEEDRKLMEILAVAIGIEEERKMAETSLIQAKSELETRVRERTGELFTANERLSNDIEERRKVEAELRKEENIRRMTFEAIPDMISVIDTDFRIIHSNWGAGYDYVPKELRDKQLRCFDLFYPGQGKRCEPCHVYEAFNTGKPIFKESINSHIGNVEIRAYPIFDESGEISMVAEHIRNITDRKKLEEELMKAQKLESLGVLAGGIAHDFNNLLTGIMGNISLARMLAAPESKITGRLEEAEKASLRAKDLTQQLLTFSRGGAPVKKSVSIKQLLLDSVAFSLRGSNVKSGFSIPEDIWPVDVDAGQMSQVLNNLVINADQAMPDGGIITVRAENVEIGPDIHIPLSEGRYVKISVEDQGIGIPETNLDRIFDPYFTTKTKGSGLGLATVYSIIRNHGGLITVETRAGSGTIFHLYIPASDISPQQFDDMVSKPHHGKGKILVMDDEDIILEVAGEILCNLGYEVEICVNGTEAISMYEQAFHLGEPYAAVLMDLTIPGGVGGKETIELLMEIDPQVKGIVSSGYSNDPVMAHFDEYGFRGVVSKPYNAEELGRTLNMVINLSD
jgi:signal transduction histidine kinase/sensor domain CHASE-containing protein/CheY-like chemotaxis protein/PAS domain-containing protein